MFIEMVPNRDSPAAVLLRESYRDEQGRAQKRTLANLSKLPRDVIEALKALLKGGTVVGTAPDELEIERSLPHGHVAAVLGTIRKVALDRLIFEHREGSGGAAQLRSRCRHDGGSVDRAALEARLCARGGSGECDLEPERGSGLGQGEGTRGL
jgi:hypothetical protein